MFPLHPYFGITFLASSVQSVVSATVLGELLYWDTKLTNLAVLKSYVTISRLHRLFLF